MKWEIKQFKTVKERITNLQKKLPLQKSVPTKSSLKIWQIIFIGFISITFTALWLTSYRWINKAVWENDFAIHNSWTLPLGIMFFSLIVGLAQKYLRAPTVIHGGALDAMKGENTTERSLPFIGTLVSSFSSVLSGASIGPEGAIGNLVEQVSQFIRRKIKLPKNLATGFDTAALASAYNGIIGSPLFTGVLATEIQSGNSIQSSSIGWNLLSGSIGYLFFILLGLPVFAHYVPFTPITTLNLSYIGWAMVLGFIGSLLAIFTGLLFQIFEKILDKRFKNMALKRTLFAGGIISMVGYFFPEVLFAGETQIFPMLQHPAHYGVFLLVFYALVKLALLALSTKSGYLGGPTFPLLFSCTMIGLALNLMFPGVPASILVLCIEAAAFSVLLRAPLTAILLVAVVGTADPYTISLLVVSSVTAMSVGNFFNAYLARYQSK